MIPSILKTQLKSLRLTLGNSSPVPVTGREGYLNLPRKRKMGSRNDEVDRVHSSYDAGVNLLGSTPKEMPSMRLGMNSILAWY